MHAKTFEFSPGRWLPFWFWLVFAGGVLMVLDVGVRRVSVEPAEVRAAAVLYHRRAR